MNFYEPRTYRTRAKLPIPAGHTKETYEVDYLTHKRHPGNSNEPEYRVRWAGVDENGNKVAVELADCERDRGRLDRAV